ncbi:MEDS domain-containing protein [Peribacillus sp. SCS-26]|uniref:MEDS domain-containing protein n=1 Tax=Paraperibacillus marinus TaxID=3115295 RepID=UPI003905F72C
MEITNLKEIGHIKGLTEGHILYFFENQDKYLSNIVDFVLSGLERNQYTIIIENDRIAPLIQSRLKSLLDSDSLNKVKIVNNFDFYYAKGDFSSNSIFEFFPSLFEDGSSPGSVVRSWAHIEWRDENGVSRKLTQSESDADSIVNKARLLSVCAYDSNRVSEELKMGLFGTHQLLLSDENNHQVN